ncbi:hypothetical protein [Lentzea sp. CA-135723]|uniref:hypothetical protein n=1 Tax=Lentzea sp. CA-135723 TaxID=3239950 RepID=UPI003D8E0433
MRKTIAATLGAAAVMAAGLMPISATTAAAADYPVTEFRVPYGASVITGSVTWHNRDVVITGELRARSSTKQARFRGLAEHCDTGIDTRTAQAGENRPFRVPFDCNYPGGFTYVVVALWDGADHRGTAVCTRQGCTNEN